MRRLPPFEYFAPTTVADAVELLARYQERASVLAGGTDLLVAMRRRTRRPAVVIDIKPIAPLAHLHGPDGAGLRLGCGVTVDAVRKSAVLRRRYGLLVEAARAIGHPQIRHRATVVGNLCNAAPSADMAPPLLALGARVHVVGPGRQRVIPLDEFFTGPFRTVLQPDELVTEIELPPLEGRVGGAYSWMPKITAVDETLVGVAAVIQFDDGVVREARVALGSVAPTPVRAHRVEAFLRGAPPSTAAFREAGRLAAGEIAPRGRSEYRRTLCALLVERALGAAAQQAASG